MLPVFSLGGAGGSSAVPPPAGTQGGPLSCSSTASAMGTIMAVVAVLLIHMDRKAVTPMKPSIRLGGGRGQGEPLMTMGS